jgi:hypothetical protein
MAHQILALQEGFKTRRYEGDPLDDTFEGTVNDAEFLNSITVVRGFVRGLDVERQVNSTLYVLLECFYQQRYHNMLDEPVVTNEYLFNTHLADLIYLLSTGRPL